MRRLLCLLLLAATLRAAPADLLLAAATDAELQPVLARMSGVRAETRAAWTWWTGTLAGKSVVLLRTEGDPLNTVAAVTLALRRFGPKLLLTFGSARAHDPALRPGDVVVGGRFAAFDGMVSPHLPLGAGSDALQWTKMAHPMMTKGEKETRMRDFPADPAALAALQALAPARGRLVTGVLGSANQVNREADRLAWLHREWGTSCEDGESAHAAGCALLLGVPAAGLRVIDGADGEAAALVLRFVEDRP